LLWERYVESQADYRASSETLARKLGEAGSDAWQLLEWLRGPVLSEWAAGAQAQLLARVFTEQFELRAVQPTALAEEKIAVVPDPVAEGSKATPATHAPTDEPALPHGPPLPQASGPITVEPKPKEQLSSERVQNPHDPEATYSVKGKGEKKKEHVGYKVQVAETVCEQVLSPGEPTRNFIIGVVTHPAYESDEAGAVKLELIVGANGQVKSVKPLGGHPLLIDAAENAVKQWRYEPGAEGTQVVEIRFTNAN
jgi:outer membrane biosynthesis protein TonB